MGLPEIIQTDRLVLRPFSPTDGPAVLAYSADPDWAEFQQTVSSTREEADGVVAQLVGREWESEPAWAITLSGRVVGVVNLVFSAEQRIALIGYGIHAEHRGVGLTEEAVRAVLGRAFSCYEQLVRVAANTDARNRRSTRLLERLGFTHEGTLRSGGVTAKGELVDGVIYGLLRSEWCAGAVE